jgi:hypothetical protein
MSRKPQPYGKSGYFTHFALRCSAALVLNFESKIFFESKTNCQYKDFAKTFLCWLKQTAPI